MIDYIILANTKSENYFKMTCDLIDSLVNTVYVQNSPFDGYRITIVETNVDSEFKYPETCDIVQFDMQKYGMFNYNYALNIGLKHVVEKGGNDWFCFMNNDVVCEPDWIQQIAAAAADDPQLQSICPNIRERADGVLYGYTLFEHLDGCCILYHKNVLKTIGAWDERFSFAYQDDDYLETLRRYNIRHAKVMSSVIRHVGSATVDYSNKLAFAGMFQFIRKWSMPVFQTREHAKHVFLNKLKEP